MYVYPKTWRPAERNEKNAEGHACMYKGGELLLCILEHVIEGSYRVIDNAHNER